MAKPFFYRLNAADFMSEVFQIKPGEHEAWLRQLAIDLVAAEAHSTFAEKLINEANNFSAIKRDAINKRWHSED